MQEIIVTTPAELSQLVQDAVFNALKSELYAAVQKATLKPFLTKEELMSLTGWSKRQIEYKKAQRKIPYIRRGRLILFPKDGVYEYLEEGRVEAL